MIARPRVFENITDETMKSVRMKVTFVYNGSCLKELKKASEFCFGEEDKIIPKPWTNEDHHLHGSNQDGLFRSCLLYTSHDDDETSDRRRVAFQMVGV